MRGALLLAALGIVLEVRGDKQAPFRGDKPQLIKKRGKLNILQAKRVELTSRAERTFLARNGFPP